MSENYTEEQKQAVLEFNRYVSKDFPEYHKFLTGEIIYKPAVIVNHGNMKTEIIGEVCKGKLSEVLDVYINLKLEERFEKTFFGRIRSIFKTKRMPYDRDYILSHLKRYLSSITLDW